MLSPHSPFSLLKKKSRQRIGEVKPGTKFEAPEHSARCREGAAAGFISGGGSLTRARPLATRRSQGLGPVLPSGPVRMFGAHPPSPAALLGLGNVIITTGRQLCASGFLFLLETAAMEQGRFPIPLCVHRSPSGSEADGSEPGPSSLHPRVWSAWRVFSSNATTWRS